MKDFDKAAAKHGATVCTIQGWSARILCFDKKGGYGKIVAALLRPNGEEDVAVFYDDGRYYNDDASPFDLMMADDDYIEKLERGEYDHIEDNLEMEGKPDHIGESAEKVHDPRSLGNEWLNDMIKARSSIFKDLERSLDIERRKYELSKLKHETEMLELERIPENWDYWRRMYAGMALQGLVASDKWRMMEIGDRVFVCVQMADALVDELKNTKK